MLYYRYIWDIDICLKICAEISLTRRQGSIPIRIVQQDTQCYPRHEATLH